MNQTVDTNMTDQEGERHHPLSGGPLEYPWGDQTPAAGECIEVAKGIFWTRLPLPWSLDHINVYLIDEGDSWTVIDTGVDGGQTRKAWTAIAENLFKDKPVRRVICTHYHLDHAGSAGWLCKHHGATLWMSETEFLYARIASLRTGPARFSAMIDFQVKAGMKIPDKEQAAVMTADMLAKGMGEPPLSFFRLIDGAEFEMGGRRWRVVTGRGHSPEHACLECIDEPILISGDQVIAEITSLVSVGGDQPDANPLALWIESLNRLQAVHPDVLVLPSHKRPFKRLHQRLDDLLQDHKKKLGLVVERCKEEASAMQVVKPLFGRKLDPFNLVLALGETVAHLNLLIALGVIVRREENGTWRYTTTGVYNPDQLMADILALPGIRTRNIPPRRD